MLAVSSGPTRKVSVVVALFVLLVIVSSLGVYEYATLRTLQGQNAGPSSAESSLAANLSSQSNAYTSLESSYLEDNNTGSVVQSFQLHAMHIDEKNATTVGTDYKSNATMKWEGRTDGFGGTYAGSGSIEFTWQSFLGYAKNVTVAIRSVNATALPNETVALRADLFFEGYSGSVGSFNITTSGPYSYVFQSGEWKITQEQTLFEELNTEYSCGAGGPCGP